MCILREDADWCLRSLHPHFSTMTLCVYSLSRRVSCCNVLCLQASWEVFAAIIPLSLSESGWGASHTPAVERGGLSQSSSGQPPRSWAGGRQEPLHWTAGHVLSERVTLICVLCFAVVDLVTYCTCIKLKYCTCWIKTEQHALFMTDCACAYTGQCIKVHSTRYNIIIMFDAKKIWIPMQFFMHGYWYPLVWVVFCGQWHRCM